MTTTKTTMRDEAEEEERAVVIRCYDPKTDQAGTEAVDRECELAPAGGMSLHADLLGDPVARIRHSPHHLMLVRRRHVPVGVRIRDTRVRRLCVCVRIGVRGRILVYDCASFTRLHVAISGG
jgi:hypothetical protein